VRKPRAISVKACYDSSIRIVLGTVREDEDKVEIQGWALLTYAQAVQVRYALDKHIAYLQAKKAERRSG